MNCKMTVFRLNLYLYAILLFLFSLPASKGISQPAGTGTDKMSILNKQPVIIAIDPGHPSETSNGCSHHGMSENELCWQIALKLENLIASEPNMRAIKTKNSINQMVTNRERAEIANRADANLLLRLHCDTGNGSGCTIYYPDKQGRAQGVTGPSREIIEKSLIAAELMQSGLAEILGKDLTLNQIKTDSQTFVGNKQGALTGSIFSKVPALVVEMVYLNNASDAAFIKEPQNQLLLAKALLNGIKKATKVAQ